MRILLIGVLFFAGCKGEKTKEVKKEEKPNRIVMVIANKNFRDEELFVPKDVFLKNGFSVTVASNDTVEAKGMLGRMIKPDILIKDINPADYDALVLVGGSGCMVLWNDTTLHRIVRKFYEDKKVIGAICLSPVILARAGILKGKKVTCFYTAKEEILKGEGEYIDAMLATDGNIVTAPGPQSAEIYAKTIVSFLKSKKVKE